jgi:hypothetical protein
MLDQEQKDQEVQTTNQGKDKEVEPAQNEQMDINIDAGTAFNLKLQEFDKKIANAEWQVASLKKERATYIYDQNVQQIVMAHRESKIRAQVEEEARKKISG